MNFDEVPLAKHSHKGLYTPSHWDVESKESYRKWVAEKIVIHSKTILGRDKKLHSNLFWVSLTGNEMAETKWFLKHYPFFNPKQLLAVDYNRDEGKGQIDPQVAAQIGVPPEHLFVDYPLKNALQMLRVRYKIAIINADLTCSLMLDTIRTEVAPLIVSFKRSYDKVGECFLFVNMAAECVNIPTIKPGAKEVYDWLDSRQILRDYFDEPDYRGRDLLLGEWYTGQGINKTTRMFCFCLHLVKPGVA